MPKNEVYHFQKGELAMTMERVREFLSKRPFVPYDIRMSDGRVLTVDHPDFLSVTRKDSIIFTTEDDRVIFIDVHHIVALEVANRPAAA